MFIYFFRVDNLLTTFGSCPKTRRCKRLGASGGKWILPGSATGLAVAGRSRERWIGDGSGKGKGTLTLHFNTYEELNVLGDKLKTLV